MEANAGSQIGRARAWANHLVIPTIARLWGWDDAFLSWNMIPIARLFTLLVEMSILPVEKLPVENGTVASAVVVVVRAKGTRSVSQQAPESFVSGPTSPASSNPRSCSLSLSLLLLLLLSVALHTTSDTLAVSNPLFSSLVYSSETPPLLPIPPNPSSRQSPSPQILLDFQSLHPLPGIKLKSDCNWYFPVTSTEKGTLLYRLGI
jgi:hypothetical protein